MCQSCMLFSELMWFDLDVRSQRGIEGDRAGLEETGRQEAMVVCLAVMMLGVGRGMCLEVAHGRFWARSGRAHLW